MLSEQLEESSDSEALPYPGKEFSLDKIERGKKSQYLSMRSLAVNRDPTTKGVIQAFPKRRPVNKKLNNDQNFTNEDDILDLLFSRNPTIDCQQIRKREITFLNKFYEKSSEKIAAVLADGTTAPPEKRQYCKVPRIEFKVSQNTKKFEKNEQEAIFKEQQTVARSFVFRDYGFTAFEAELAENPTTVQVELRSYRNILGRVVRESFRRLESFAIDQCLMGVKPLNRTELKLLFIALLNCRTYFSSSDCETFLKYITLCFCLGDVTITAQASVKLMSSIHQFLKKRMEEKAGGSGEEESMMTSRGGFTNEKYQMHRIWNGQLQRLLLETYRREPNMSRIAKIFKRAYPKKQCFFTPEALRIRINRTLRESIKKLQFLRENQSENGANLPEMGRISKFSFKAIMESPQLYRLRLMLLDVNTAESCSHNLLLSTIKALNESLRTWDSIRAEQQRNSRAPRRADKSDKMDVLEEVDLSELLEEEAGACEDDF